MNLPFPLQDGERVILLTRRHWLYFVPKFAGYALAAIVPVVVLLAILAGTGNLKGTGLAASLIVSALWIAFWLFRIVLLKYRFDRDLWAITDRRVVDLVATSPLHFRMSTADLVQIQDISIERNGMLQSMFDFGDILCQTAGEVPHFSFRAVPNPRAIGATLERESLAAKGRARGLSPIADAPTERLTQ